MRGFTLVEVLVALVVLEVGLLGTVGTVVLASRILSSAEQRERAVVQTGLLLDSLAGVAGAGSGLRSGEWGEVAWTRDGRGRIEVEVTPRGGAPYSVQGWSAPPTATGSP